MNKLALVLFPAVIFAATIFGCKTTEAGGARNGNRTESRGSQTDLARSIESEEVFDDYHFPTTIESFDFVRVRIYEKDFPGGGVSASYVNDKDETLTIFFYDLIRDDIPNGVDSDLIQKEVSRNLSQLRLSGISKVGEPLMIQVGSHPFIMIACTGEMQEQHVFDLTLLTGLHNAIFKVRITCPGEPGEGIPEKLSPLLEDLYEKVVAPNLGAGGDDSETFMILASQEEYYELVFPGDAIVQADQLERVERGNLVDPTDIAALKTLSESYYNSSEKVWAIIYGEAYLNNAGEPSDFEAVSRIVYASYVDHIEVIEESRISSSLARAAVINPVLMESPFELNFEISTLMGLVNAGDIEGFSLETFYRMRQGQLDFWKDEFQKHALIEYWKELESLGLLQPYCYWLFRCIHPEEYAVWESQHGDELQRFLSWKAENCVRLLVPGLNRLSLASGQ